MEYKSRVKIKAASEKNILRRHFIPGLVIIGMAFCLIIRKEIDFQKCYDRQVLRVEFYEVRRA